MLANSFMKAEALGISEAEVAALIHVLGMLDRGELKHGIDGEGARFVMSATFTHTECGTMGCIGGYVAMFMGIEDDANRYVSQYWTYGSLSPLYFPCDRDGDLLRLSKITVAQAANGLRNYLTTGDPRWAEALAE